MIMLSMSTLTKKLASVAARYAHELLLPSWMVREVWRDVINLAVECGPRILASLMLLQHRRRNAQQRVDSLRYVL